MNRENDAVLIKLLKTLNKFNIDKRDQDLLKIQVIFGLI